MGRLVPKSDVSVQTAPMAVGLFLAVSALVWLCAKHVTRAASKKLASSGSGSNSSDETSNCRIAPRSPLASMKQLLTALTNKTVPFLCRKKKNEESGEGTEVEGFGAGGLWQREILMGEKCQPLDFPGVIYYDGDGNRQAHLPPRSPRGSLLLQSSFSLPATLGEKGGK